MKPKKMRIIIPIILLPIIAVFFLCTVMTVRCAMTSPPDDLAPKEVIYQLAKYRNSGNEKGISMLCSESCNIAVSEKPFSLYECIIRENVKITECSEIAAPKDSRYPKLYDKHYFRVIWDSDSIEWDWRSNGFAFLLIAKESEEESAPYKICSMFTGF